MKKDSQGKLPFLCLLAGIFVCMGCSDKRSALREQDTLLHLRFDWRMGQTDIIRAGSALFLRFVWDRAEEKKTVERIYLLDGNDAQWGVNPLLITIVGEKKTIGIVVIPPEETIRLAAGEYTLKIEGSFNDETGFSSAPMQFRLFPEHTMLSDAALLNERQRFAAFLLLQNDTTSYEIVAPSVVENNKQNVLAHQLILSYRFIFASYPAESEEETGREVLNKKARTPEERERWDLFQEEMMARQQSIRNDR